MPNKDNTDYIKELHAQSWTAVRAAQLPATKEGEEPRHLMYVRLLCAILASHALQQPATLEYDELTLLLEFGLPSELREIVGLDTLLKPLTHDGPQVPRIT